MNLGLNVSTQQKCLPFLATLYMAVMICSNVFGNKLILTYFGVVSAASFISPVWYILSDIIAELYGYKIAKKLFWSVIICQLLFSLSCYFLIQLHSPIYWNGQEGYRLVLGDSFKFSAISFFSIIIAWHLNAKLLVKWKILMNGKYFWLRSISSSGIGLIIYSILSVSIIMYGVASTGDLSSIILGSCLLKIIYLILLAYPATIVVALLNSVENRQS